MAGESTLHMSAIGFQFPAAQEVKTGKLETRKLEVMFSEVSGFIGRSKNWEIGNWEIGYYVFRGFRDHREK